MSSEDLLTRQSLGFLLAKAAQRWNAQLSAHFEKEGYAHVRPSFGSVLLPLFEEDGLRLTELAERGGISKQTMTTLIRKVEAAGLVARKVDLTDARASRIYLTAAARRFAPVASRALKGLEASADAVSDPKAKHHVVAWLRNYIRG